MTAIFSIILVFYHIHPEFRPGKQHSRGGRGSEPVGEAGHVRLLRAVLYGRRIGAVGDFDVDVVEHEPMVLGEVPVQARREVALFSP